MTYEIKAKLKLKIIETLRNLEGTKKRKPVLLITHIVFPTAVIGSIITGEKRVFSSIIARGAK